LLSARLLIVITGVSAAPDEVTSLSATGPVSAGGIAFTTTHWSAVLAAQGESPEAKAALEKLCRTYWWPLYGFVRRQGYKPEEAQDLTQGFFALLLERRDLDTARKEKGRLRSYLLTSLKHFLTNERQRAMAVKRGEGQRLIPLDELRERERGDFEAADALEALFLVRIQAG
jgi:DNA-directed RNA polymerase specialized sigma24 family protein